MNKPGSTLARFSSADCLKPFTIWSIMSFLTTLLRRRLEAVAQPFTQVLLALIPTVFGTLFGTSVAAQSILPKTEHTVSATVLPASGMYPEIVVFYQGKGRPESLERDGVRMQLGWDLPEVPTTVPRRLVVLSHGSNGNPWQQSDLAQQLVHAGFVVAAPFHVGDSSRDHDHSTISNWTNWKLRPTYVTATIDAMAQSKRWTVRTDKVGVYGMSAGGHTALTLAGGKWSVDQLRRHCNQHVREDFLICSEGRSRLKGDWLDWLRMARTLARNQYYMRDGTLHGHIEPRVAAVVVEVPVLGEFDMKSLTNSTRAIGVVQALDDQYANPLLHSGALLRACRHCVELASVSGAGHLSFISPAVPPEVGTDAPGFDRRVVADVQAKVAAFYVRHLIDEAGKKGKP